ncbi:ABC transporter permease subunit [Endozoicomonas montiporae]|uniref:Putrescine transport system permease protein n=1 Tax=Endozoicomonas montiporae CL-33 TaxID=570277 RepID=A0A142BFG5_9GAMM|nr:ABC transporter permease subunit [Endozoicomonas montiporae]AMO57491.1 putrescine transport system permease protein [Endozoicomonas montiporae CL-33]
MKTKMGFSNWVLIAGLLFLYVPMLILVIYSFNESRLVTVWAGFSSKWYLELFRDEQIIDAVWTSLKISFWSANMAVVLATMAAFVMTRLRKFRGKTAFSSMITAPLVMPDVITGLSLLLLFVAMANSVGWPADRGMLTIWIAHVTFCTAYATVVISSRLQEVDRSVEEAAMDLGSPPFKTFMLITLPAILPAIAAGWLLSFTLSLDDLVISSFVSGPGATTLPMVVFSSVRLGITPKINALATLIILAVSLAAFVSWWLLRRQEARRVALLKREMEDSEPLPLPERRIRTVLTVEEKKQRQELTVATD